VGTPVSMDKSTEEWQELEFARLRVRLPIQAEARIKTMVKINGKVYQVLIKEETPSREYPKCWCGVWGKSIEDGSSSNALTNMGFIGLVESEGGNFSDDEFWESMRQTEDTTMVSPEDG